jgi:hypothetical protein
MNTVYVDPNQLLQTQVQDYVPYQLGYGSSTIFHRKRPLFTLFSIREMELSPQVLFGLWLIKGPIMTKSRFLVDCDNEEVRQFVVNQINSFWNNGAVQALNAIEWGYSGSEVIYETDEDTQAISYKHLKYFDAQNTKVVTKNGNRTGLLIDNFLTLSMQPGKAVYLGGPKAFHHVHWRHLHPWYGRSRLVGAYIPWYEKWSEGGYRDIRRLWFYKNAFEGGIIYHPNGYVKTPDGQLIAYQDLAQSMIEKKRTGGVWAFPSDTDARGNKKWEYQDPKGNTIPAGLFDYGDKLDDEILEAMGIPTEVVRSMGNEGFGSSTGRQIPETAFYSILQEEVQWLMFDFVEQVIKPLVQINAALKRMPYEQFRVLTYPLMTDSQEENSEMDQDERSEAGENQNNQPSEQNRNSSTSSNNNPQTPAGQDVDQSIKLQVAA